MTISYLGALLVAVVLLVYLGHAMLKPEEF